VRGQKGELVKSPAAQLVRDNATIIARVGEQLGLSPGSRSRLSVSTESVDETTNRWLT
jgi:P27 family predicted phage terminase small subunit